MGWVGGWQSLPCWYLGVISFRYWKKLMDFCISLHQTQAAKLIRGDFKFAPTPMQCKPCHDVRILFSVYSLWWHVQVQPRTRKKNENQMVNDDNQWMTELLYIQYLAAEPHQADRHCQLINMLLFSVWARFCRCIAGTVFSDGVFGIVPASYTYSNISHAKFFFFF